jgi:hypothetical protein
MESRSIRCSGCASVFREYCEWIYVTGIGCTRYTKKTRRGYPLRVFFFHVFTDLLAVVGAIKRFKIGKEEVIVIVMDPQE